MTHRQFADALAKKSEHEEEEMCEHGKPDYEDCPACDDDECK